MTPRPPVADRRRAWLIAGLIVLVAIAVFLATRPSGGPTVQPSASPSSASSASASSSSGASGSPGTSPAPPSPSASASAVPPPPSASPAPTAPPGSDVAGSWTGTWTNTSPDANSGALTLVLNQVGMALEGTLRMDASTCVTEQVVSGTIDDGRIELQNSLRDEVELEGRLSGSTLTGTYSMSCDNASGSWTVTRD